MTGISMPLRPSILPLVAALAILCPLRLAAVDAVDEEGSVSAGNLLDVSSSLQREKRAAARDGGWPVTASIGAGAGWNSNLYDAWSGAEIDTAILVEAGELEIEHRPSTQDRWRMALKAQGTQYLEDSEANALEIGLSTDWKHAFTDAVNLKIDAGVTSKDTASFTALGTKLTRETSYLAYDAGTSVDVDVTPADNVAIGIGYRRKDYDETTGLNTLDWDKVGGSVHYRHKSAWWTGRLWYDLDVQKYDEEPASDTTGLELPTYPAEDHVLQSVLAWWSADLTPTRTLTLKLKYSTKDDRYESYESWNEWRLTAGFSAVLSEHLHVGIEGWYAMRDYEHILADVNQELSYDKFSFDAWARWYFNAHWSFLVEAQTVVRDSNKNAGTIYRDYTVYEVLSGVSAAF